MAEYQLSFDGFCSTFFCNGNHYLWLRVYSYEHFVKDTLTHILMLLGLVGFSAFFSFVVFMDKSMWSGSPDLTLSVITGFFTATVIFYMFYVLIYSFCRMGEGE